MSFKPTVQAQQSIHILCAYFFTLVLLIGCGIFLQQIAPDDAPVAEDIKALFISRGKYLMPEIKERTLFVPPLGFFRELSIPQQQSRQQ